LHHYLIFLTKMLCYHISCWYYC